MANIETTVGNLKINRLTQTQLNNASSLSNFELYMVDPEFTGGKILVTDSNGDIVESALTSSGVQLTANLVTSVSSSSTDAQYPSAKLFYDTCGDIETLINAL